MLIRMDRESQQVQQLFQQMCGTPERRYNLCKLTRQRLAKHLFDKYGSLASEKLVKQLNHHFNRGPVEFEQFCVLCEDYGTCS